MCTSKSKKICPVPDHVVHTAYDEDLPVSVKEPDISNPGEARLVEVFGRQSFVAKISLR